MNENEILQKIDECERNILSSYNNLIYTAEKLSSLEYDYVVERSGLAKSAKREKITDIFLMLIPVFLIIACIIIWIMFSLGAMWLYKALWNGMLPVFMSVAAVVCFVIQINGSWPYLDKLQRRHSELTKETQRQKSNLDYVLKNNTKI